MGRKVFTREVFASADVNTYLMDQAVMTFPSAAARGVDLPAPKDGQITYLEDVDRFDERIAGAWVSRKPQNYGTTGVLSGTAPPAGTPLLRKYVAGTYTSSAFGDNTIVYPGAAFPNGVLYVNAVAAPSGAGPFYQWVPWGANLSQMNIRLMSGSASQVNTAQLSCFEIVGW